MVYPRRLCIEVGSEDPLFDSRYSEASFARIRDYCQKVGTQWIEMLVFDGVHEFCKEDMPIKRLIEDIYKAGAASSV